MNEWLDRAETLDRLGVRPQTLYAYVSRGKIGQRADPEDPRKSLYRAEDIEALRSRRARGRRPATIAAGAMAWGEPVITTRISTVIHGRLIYRGRDAVELSAHHTLEDIAALLWECRPPVSFAGSGSVGGSDPFTALAGLVAVARPTIGRGRERLCADAANAVTALAGGLGIPAGPEPLHDRLGALWSLDRAGTDLVRRILVLLADHELNPSTFAARVGASTGASIAASLLAGLGALSGPRHGGAGAAVAELAETARRIGAEDAVARWLARGLPLPGFGHPLYPNGDPRAKALLEYLRDPAIMADLRQAAFDATGAPPNIDFALFALALENKMPDDAAFRLFALARSVGWAAHAMEQAASGALIRPRATYVGMQPE